MSWNQSSNSLATQPKTPQKSFAAIKGVVAGILVIVGAVTVFLMLQTNEPTPLVQDGDIKSAVIPDKHPKTHSSSWKPKKQPQATAKVQPPELKARDVIEPGVVECDAHLYPRRLFKSNCENFIAGLLRATPGDTLIGGVEMDKHFDEDFKSSLNNKIVIDPDDSEEDIAVKEVVKKTKDLLKVCMERGESPREIVQQSYEDMVKISQYRTELENNLRVLTQGGGTLEEVKRYIDESNEILAEYNAKPLKLHPRTERKLMMQEQQIRDSATTDTATDAQSMDNAPNDSTGELAQ